MSTKSREVIWGGRIMGAQIRAQGARKAAVTAVKEADRAEAVAWSIRMEGWPAQPSPTIDQCLNGGLAWLEVECNRSKTKASLPLDAIRRPRDTPIWKLEASLKCRSCRKGRSAPPVRMIKLTEAQAITPTSGCIRTRRADEAQLWLVSPRTTTPDCSRSLRIARRCSRARQAGFFVS